MIEIKFFTDGEKYYMNNEHGITKEVDLSAIGSGGGGGSSSDVVKSVSVCYLYADEDVSVSGYDSAWLDNNNSHFVNPYSMADIDVSEGIFVPYWYMNDKNGLELSPTSVYMNTQNLVDGTVYQWDLNVYNNSSESLLLTATDPVIRGVFYRLTVPSGIDNPLIV